MKDPEEGVLLIADPFLKDTHFMRTVILLCRHAEDGSFGFVLNKLSEHTLEDLIIDMAGFTLPVFAGGPVQKDTLHYIHQYPDLLPNSVQIGDEMYWGGDFGVLKTLIKNNEIDTTKIKFFLGYSGWDKEQLNLELKEKSWLTVTSTKNIVFKISANEIWKASLKHLGGKYEMLINFPIDPQLN